VKGYVWRAFVHWLVTILTLGILWPRMTFALEKYRTDRTFYGDHRFEQTGRWIGLIGAMKHVYLAAALIGAGTLAAVLSEELVWLVAAAMGGIWLALGLAYWKAESFRRLTEGKRLGAMGFRCRPRPGTIFGIYLGGSLAISGIFAVVLLIVMAALGLVLGAVFASVDLDAGFDSPEDLAGLPAWLFSLVGIAVYFLVFLLWGALRHVFITMPIARHFAEVTTITGAEGLAGVKQRERDEFAEAEGFADALPLGGGI